MPTTGKAVTRKHRHLRVPVSPVEEDEIKRLAGAAGLSIASYLRRVGLGYKITGIVDNRRVEELVRINGDLGRLGGLLKLWLTNDERTKSFDEATIRAVLSKVEDTQTMMHEVIRRVVTPKARG